MTTYADLAGDLLKEAADFLLKISQSNGITNADMMQNADTYYKMSQLIKNDPAGAVEHLSHAEMAARLLDDASTFFLAVGKTNPPIQEAMDQNAKVFKDLAKFMRHDPMAEVPKNS